MAIYFILLAIIIIGQLCVSWKALSKRIYCIIVCVCMTLISGLRDVNVGMWDTVSVYLPSFRIINQTSIDSLLKMAETQYKFIGFDLFSKLIGMISKNEQFYIFMMAWPFFVAVCILIYKYSDIPAYSFLALLAFGYFTYSFSMIRGMLSLAAIAIAFDAAIEEKWKKFIIWIIVGTSFHITALLFLIVYFIKRIRWNARRIGIIFAVLIIAQRVFPTVWQWFVQRFISNWLVTYNYYATKGGVLADALLFVYVFTVLIAILKLIVSEQARIGGIHKLSFKIKIHRSKKKKAILTEDSTFNLYIGMSVFAAVIVFLTLVLSEMIRVAMILGLGCVLLAGRRLRGCSKRNRQLIQICELSQALIYIVYFLFAALPNMHAVPYKYFWQ